MRKGVAGVAFGSMVAMAMAVGQAPVGGLVFDAASVRQSPPMDMQKMLAGLQAGKKPEEVRIEGSRATFVYMSLKELIAYAYKVPQYEVAGPEWMTTDRFEVSARMPDGTSQDDVPAMLEELLKERFGLEAHKQVMDQPVLALVLGKSGPKLQPASATAEPVDVNAPLKPNESMMETTNGRVWLTKNADGSTTYHFVDGGTFKLKFDGEKLAMHLEASAIDMKGFAMMMTTLGGGDGRQVVDRTGLTGYYQAAADFSLMDLVTSLRDQGIDIPTGSQGAGASDPGGATVSAALDKLGLKLEKTRANVDRLVVDKVEKLPTEN